MIARCLDWDSAFFGVRVAQVTLDEETEVSDLADYLGDDSADVTYVFIPSQFAKAFRDVLTKYAGVCYDHKVTYVKRVDPGFALFDPAIAEAQVETEALLALGHTSGEYSRFLLDPRFRPWFKSLYSEWVRKALRLGDERVFIATGPQGPACMATAAISEGVGQIGLIAVDEGSRGQGFGLRLMRHCEAFYTECLATSCKVVTQKNNVAACSLYLKAGYQLASEQEVWHVWNRP